MATVAIDLGTVTHTLNDHSCGVNAADFFYQDMNNAFYRSLCVKAGFELWRGMNWKRTNSTAYITAQRDFHKAMHAGLGSKYAAIYFSSAHPVPQPSGPATLTSAAVSTSTGMAPADHAAQVDDWITNHGIDVRYWGWSNESTLNAYDHEFEGVTGGTPWFYDGTLGSAASQRKCEDWDTIHHREMTAVYDAKISALGRTATMRTLGSDIATLLTSSGYGIVRKWVLGQLNSGTNPNSPASNAPYMGTMGIHTYIYFGGGITDNQGHLNALFWNEAASEAAFQAVNKGGFVAPLRWLRAHLDANGGTAVGFGIDEGGGYLVSSKPHVALTDIAQAIAFCQNAGTYNYDYLLVHMASRSDTAGEGLFLVTSVDPAQDHPSMQSEAAWKPGRRYYAFRDMWGRYMRTFKRQLGTTIQVASGNTPATSYANAVPRIQVCAGLNADGSRLGIMVCNLDMTTAEQVTLTWGTLARGQVSGTSCPLNQGAVPLPTIAAFGASATSLTTGSGGAPTLQAGHALLFEVPFSPSDPPPSGGDPHLGNWSVATQINAAAVDPPPSDPPAPDQHIGNWSVAEVIDAVQTGAVNPGLLGLPVASPSSLSLTPSSAGSLPLPPA